MPPPGIGGCADSFFGRSATIASVVITHDLRWVDDALAREIPVLARLSVVAEGIGRPFENLPDNHRAIFASIDGDQAGRTGQRFADELQ
jgi:hypothetical protein